MPKCVLNWEGLRSLAMKTVVKKTDMNKNYRLVMLTTLILALFIFFGFLVAKKYFSNWKIYNLKELEIESIKLPPTTVKDAIYAAYSLPGVKVAMTDQHQRLLEQASSTASYLNEEPTLVYWIADGDEKHPPEVSEHSWFITFRSNFMPAYICEISFSDTEIVQGVGQVDCSHKGK